MKLNPIFREEISDALQKSKIGHPNTVSVLGLIEKLLLEPNIAEKCTEINNKCFPVKAAAEDKSAKAK